MLRRPGVRPVGDLEHERARGLCARVAGEGGGHGRDEAHRRRRELSVKPVVRVVGLGPGDARHITRRTFDCCVTSPVVRLRTRVTRPRRHFATSKATTSSTSVADSFDELYAAIVDDLVASGARRSRGEVALRRAGFARGRRAHRRAPARALDDVTTVTRAGGLGDRPGVRGARPRSDGEGCASWTRSAPRGAATVRDRCWSSRRTRPEILASVADRLPRRVRSRCFTTSGSTTR